MTEKYKRKIIQIGRSSNAVIIPRGWIRFNKLIAGDYVDLIVDDVIKIKPLKNHQTPQDRSQSNKKGWEA